MTHETITYSNAPKLSRSPRGRPHCTDSKLGARIKLLNIKAVDVGFYCDIYHTTLSEYLSGRRDIIPRHLVALARFLECDPYDITGLVEAGGDESQSVTGS